MHMKLMYISSGLCMLCVPLKEPKEQNEPLKNKRLPINHQEDNNPASCPTGNPVMTLLDWPVDCFYENKN